MRFLLQQTMFYGQLIFETHPKLGVAIDCGEIGVAKNLSNSCFKLWAVLWGGLWGVLWGVLWGGLWL